MCGIAGIFKKIETINESDKHALERIIHALAHRGPDFQQVKQIDKQLLLAHARLSIIDLSDSGNQPFSYKNRYYVVFNGEIFNYLELKTELKLKGYLFYSETDTEVILAAYDCWGEACLNRFNGMWAFCIWDNLKQELFISRDRYGIKPFYFINNEEYFIFSSEIIPLKTYLGSSATINVTNLDKILNGKLNYSYQNDTYIREIQSLEAGCSIIFTSDKKRKNNKWYQLPKAKYSFKTKNEWIEAFRDLFFDSIQLRLRSDVPLATCLSGGLDSGSIVSSLHHLEKKGFVGKTSFVRTAYTASFPGSTLDELNMAEKLTNELGLQHEVVSITCPSPDELINAIKSMDGPMHALAFFPIWKLYKKISDDGIKVTLDGQGPDELFGGYLTSHLFAAAINDSIANRSLRRFIDVTSTLKELSMYNATVKTWSEGFSANKLKNGLTYLFLNKNKSFFTTNQLRVFLKNQFFESPLPTILQQYDRCSMSHGVECRMPFMDYRLVELGFEIPDELKLGAGNSKRVIREAMNGILPDEIRLPQKKIGFNAPFNEWMQTGLKDWVLDEISSEKFLTSSYFDGRSIQKEIEEAILKKQVSWKQAWELWPKLHFSLLMNS